MYKGLGKPIIRDITLKEDILYIKSNKLILIGYTIDSSIRIIS